MNIAEKYSKKTVWELCVKAVYASEYYSTSMSKTFSGSRILKEAMPFSLKYLGAPDALANRPFRITAQFYPQYSDVLDQLINLQYDNLKIITDSHTYQATDVSIAYQELKSDHLVVEMVAKDLTHSRGGRNFVG